MDGDKVTLQGMKEDHGSHHEICGPVVGDAQTFLEAETNSVTV